MTSSNNASELAKAKAEIFAEGKNFAFNEEEPNNGETAHFFFVGKHNGEEVLFDAVMYTLELAYGAKLYEVAEKEALKQFPDMKAIDEDSEEGYSDEIEEFIASVILDLEEEDSVKVMESLLIDEDFGTAIGLEVAINVAEITEEVLSTFVEEYTSGKFVLDTTLYSFQDEGDIE